MKETRWLDGQAFQTLSFALREGKNLVGQREWKLFLAVIVAEHMEVPALLQTGKARRAGIRFGKIRGPREQRPPPSQHHLLRCIRGANICGHRDRNATRVCWAGRITACLASALHREIHPPCGLKGQGKVRRECGLPWQSKERKG